MVGHKHNMALMKYFRSDSKCSNYNPLSLSGPTDVNEERLLIEAVLKNPIILQVILKHVLQNGKETLCPRTAKTLRLVSRAWLLETNLVFRKSSQPLIFLTNENLNTFLANPPFQEMGNWVAPLSLSLSLETFSFKCISFPRNITRMEMSAPLSLDSLVLQGSDILEGMKVLKLNIISNNDLLFKKNLASLFSCLNLGSSSLEELELKIDFDIFLQNRDLQVTLNFPQMVTLKKMKIDGQIWRLDTTKMEHNLGGRLPKLEQLEIGTTSGDIFFGEWCHNSVFSKVESLELILLDNMKTGPVAGVQFSMEAVQQMLRSFPHVVYLQLAAIDVRELTGLRYLFGHMGGQLKVLSFSMRGEILSEDEIDGLFIGAEPELVRRLKKEPTLWGKFLEGDFGEEGVCTSSIRDFKSLNLLAVHGDIKKNTGQGQQVDLKNLLSDLAFELGFMHLPKLGGMVLKQSFGVSEEMAYKWCKRKEGMDIITDKKIITGRRCRENGGLFFRCVRGGMLVGICYIVWKLWQ